MNAHLLYVYRPLTDAYVVCEILEQSTISGSNNKSSLNGSLTLAIKEKRCEASKMAYFFVNFSIFFLSNV